MIAMEIWMIKIEKNDDHHHAVGRVPAQRDGVLLRRADERLYCLELCATLQVFDRLQLQYHCRYLTVAKVNCNSNSTAGIDRLQL